MAQRSILLVEDDRDQRATLADILRAHGYAVTEADSAERALDLIDGGEFDLVITDYQLGGATGSWLARIATSSMRPAPRVLVITGHDSAVDTGGLRVLYKPFDVTRFLSEVLQALSFDPGEPAPAPPRQRIAFILYVSDSLSSTRTIAQLREWLAAYDESQVSLTIVDLSTDTSHQAEEHRIVATPTLLKTFPAPRVWIAGKLDRPEIIARLLEHAGVEARK